MKQIPPPSPQAVQTLLEVVASCKNGKPQEAAKNLVASSRVISVIPSMVTDLYHFANAAVKLHIEQLIEYQGLRQVIVALKEEDIQLTGPEWVGGLYKATPSQAGPRSPDADTHIARDRHSGISQIDLDHLTEDQLLGMGSSLLSEGSRAYDRRDPDEAMRCFRDALRIAQHLGYPNVIATCLFEIGFVLHTQRNPLFAEEHYKQAIELAGTASPGATAQYIFHASRFFELEGNIPKAHEYAWKALKMFEQANDKDGILECQKMLGTRRR
jgi:tetratricopeptide (TPR) repeat protein